MDLPERFIKEEPNIEMNFKKVISRERSSSISKIENKTTSLSTTSINTNTSTSITTTTPPSNKRSVSTSKTIKTIPPSPSQSPPTVDFTNSIQIPRNTEEEFLLKLNRRRNCEFKQLMKIIKKQEEEEEVINEIINITADTTTTVSTDFNSSDVLSLNDIDMSNFHSPCKNKDKNDVNLSFTTPVKNKDDVSVSDVDYSFSSPVNKVVSSIKNIDLEDNNKSVPSTPPTPQCKLPDEEKITYDMENAFQILLQSRRNACYKTILNMTKI